MDVPSAVTTSRDPTVPTFAFVDIHLERHAILDNALGGAGNDKVGFAFHVDTSGIFCG